MTFPKRMLKYIAHKKKTQKCLLKDLPMVGVEPTRGCPHKILSLARLPIPSHRHKFNCHIHIISKSAVMAATVEGGVTKTGTGNSSRIIDNTTNMPVPHAKVTLPKQNYTTYSDTDGGFNLNAKVDGTTVLSVEKEGYRPYSLTIDEKSAARPIIVGIEKSKPNDLVIENAMLHLGDDNFSPNSANSSEFRAKSIGPFYSKTFQIAANAISKTNYLVIGSIIGIDTLMARSLKQNSIVNSYASPPEVYFNGSKIAEIQLNGDGQRIKIPNNLIRGGQINEVTIKTGRNMKQTAYIDYDDIEIMNLSIQTE